MAGKYDERLLKINVHRNMEKWQYIIWPLTKKLGAQAKYGT